MVRPSGGPYSFTGGTLRLNGRSGTADGNASLEAALGAPAREWSDAFGADISETLGSLARERDPALRREALFSLARQAENGDRLEAASRLYAASDAWTASEDAFTHRSRIRLDAIEGRGAVLPRAEFLLRRTARQAADPAMIAGMGAAGLVFRSVRLGVLSRLAATPQSLLTRGIGARLVAATAGFLLEAPAFTAAVRGANLFLGREQDWSRRAVWDEFAGGALVLLSLKLMGGLGGTALRRFNRGLAPGELSLSRRAISALLPQAGTFSGIALGHQLEETFGFRPHVDGATFLTDTLATYLNLHAGGRLAHEVLGGRFRAAEALVARQSEMLVQSGENEGGPTAGWREWFLLPAPALPALAHDAPAGNRGRWDPLSGPNLTMMASTGRRGAGGGRRRGAAGQAAVPRMEPYERTSLFRNLTRWGLAQALPETIKQSLLSGEIGEDRDINLDGADRPETRRAIAFLQTLLEGRRIAATASGRGRRLSLPAVEQCAAWIGEKISELLTDAEEAAVYREILEEMRALALPPEWWAAAFLNFYSADVASRDEPLDMLGALRQQGESMPKNRRVYFGRELLHLYASDPEMEAGHFRLFSALETDLNRNGKNWRRSYADYFAALRLLPLFTSAKDDLEMMCEHAETGEARGLLDHLANFAAIERHPEKIRLLEAMDTATGVDFDTRFAGINSPAQRRSAFNHWMSLSRLFLEFPDRAENWRHVAVVWQKPKAAPLFWTFYRLHRGADRPAATFLSDWQDVLRPGDATTLISDFGGTRTRIINLWEELRAFLPPELCAELLMQPAMIRAGWRGGELPAAGVAAELLEVFLSPVTARAFLRHARRTLRFSKREAGALSWPIAQWAAVAREFREEPAAEPIPGAEESFNSHLSHVKGQESSIWALLKRLSESRSLAGNLFGNAKWEIIHNQLLALERRPQGRRLFRRTDVLLHADLISGGRATADPLSVRTILKQDFEEMSDEMGDVRGSAFGRWIRVLHAGNHPHTAALSELIMEQALEAPPRHRRHALYPSGEQAVLATLDALFEPQTLSILEGIPWTPKGRSQYERARTLASTMQRVRNPAPADPEAGPPLQDVESIFYAPDPESEPRINPAPVRSLPPSSEETGATLPEAERPDPKAALARLGSGNALAPIRASADPMTGLASLDLGGGMRVGLWHGVAPVAAEATEAGRRDWDSRSDSLPIETGRELAALDQEQYALRVAEADRAGSSLMVPERLAALKRLDSVALAMNARLGKNAEARFLTEIANSVSIEHGLHLFELALREKLREPELRIDSVPDLNRVLPDVTALEVALVSLTERIPRLFLHREGLTLPLRITLSGIEWANDDYNPKTQRQGLYPVDAFVHMGITGIREGTESTGFQPRIRSLLQQALKTQLSDRHFFNRLWDGYPESAGAGLRMLKEFGNPRALLRQEWRDTDHPHYLLPLSRVARLIGLLERLPSFLNEPDLPRVYFKPFATGLLFFDGEGEAIEHVNYHPHLRRQGFHEVYEGTEASESDDNHIAHTFVGNKVLGAVYDRALNQIGEGYSLIEELSTEFALRFGIHLPLALQKVDPAEPTAPLSYKMGPDEIRELTEVFSRLPAFVLARARDGTSHGGGIRTIRKEHSAHLNMIDLTHKNGVLGRYDPWARALSFFHMRETPFRSLDEAGRAMWRDTVLHEIGEALFDGLTPEERLDFVGVFPWRRTSDVGGSVPAIHPGMLELIETGDWFTLTPALPEAELRRHLLTSYSSSNPRDLFCEAFMAYVNHGPEFRSRAETSPYLREMYRHIRDRLFSTPEGSVEYREIASLSLAELEGQVTRWRHEGQQLSAQEALEEAHEAAMESSIGATALSWNAVQEAEDAAELAERRWESGSERFVEAYYSLLENDESATRRQGREDWAAGTPETADRNKMEDTFADALAEHVFADLLGERGWGEEDVLLEEEFEEEIRLFQEEEEWDESEAEPPREGLRAAIEVLAGRVWRHLRNGRQDRARDAIARMIDGIHVRDPAARIDEDAEDILDLLTDTALSELGRGPGRRGRLTQALARHLLPGQFGREDLLRLETILAQNQTSFLRAIRPLYDFLMGRKRWHLTGDQAADIVTQLASPTHRISNRAGRSLIPDLIRHFEGEPGDLYAVADSLGLEAGSVDAFAENFLPAEGYRLWVAGSERGRLADHLTLDLQFQDYLLELWSERHGEAPPPFALTEGRARSAEVLETLRLNRDGSLEAARNILEDADRSRRLADWHRTLIREPEPPPEESPEDAITIEVEPAGDS